MSKKGTPYIRVFEDCIKDCHSIPNRDKEYKGGYYEIREVESCVIKPHEYPVYQSQNSNDAN